MAARSIKLQYEFLGLYPHGQHLIALVFDPPVQYINPGAHLDGKLAEILRVTKYFEGSTLRKKNLNFVDFLIDNGFKGFQEYDDTEYVGVRFESKEQAMMAKLLWEPNSG